jgi:hypothetical protein
VRSPIRPLAALALFALAAPALPADAGPEWVEASNGNARVLLEVLAKYSPEGATQLGVDGFEQEILDLSRDPYQPRRADTLAAMAELRRRLEAEQHPKVRQDLEILITSAEDTLASGELSRKHFFPYSDPASLIYGVVRGMLDPRAPEENRRFLVTRLEKYAGEARGYRPLTDLARERTLERLAAEPGLTGPFKGDVERDLANVPVLTAGMRDLLEKSGLKGWRKPYAALERQMTGYYAWVRGDILPRARIDHRLPEEIYADNLKRVGVDVSPDELVAKALTAFAEIRNEMQALSALIAQERRLDDADYRAVIRALKAGQIPADQVLPLYQARLAAIEGLIVANRIVTLPDRKASIRLASLAETAQVPAPHMKPPRLIGNTGEYGEFVLPVSLPPDPGGKQLHFDDFSHDAGTWTLTAHEARPGHELQYARMVETGVSQARALFAANSVNAEGWALYAEAEVKPYLPLEGQLFALQHRMLRAARAFLDPMVNRGQLTPEQVRDFLQSEAVFSEAMATQEMQRYTFLAPGQATSYFYGYQRLMETRQAAEVALRSRFDRQAFNDFILDQGLLPPALLRKAVTDEFIPSRLGN